MFKMRVALLGAMTLLVVSGFAASTASASGPAWKVNGAKLAAQTKKQIKLSTTGAVLASTVTGLTVTVTCTKGEVGNAYIEGNGEGAGQGGSTGIVFSSCTASGTGTKNCKVEEPIDTTQLKAHLVRYEEQKIGELNEPTQAKLFTTVKFAATGSEACSLKEFPVTGSVVGELKPEKEEAQVGTLSFPATAITKVKLESQERTVGLKLGTESAKFTAAFEGRLAGGGTFGVYL